MGGSSVRQTLHKLAVRSLLLACLLSGVAGAQAAAATIRGQVINGTANRPASRQKLLLLMPKGGMQVAAETFAGPRGNFVFSGRAIDPSNFYLVQATHDGADYHAPVQFDPDGNALISLTVFDSTPKPPALRIRAARILVQASGHLASVRELYAIKNGTEPPRTYVNPKGTFGFHLSPAAGPPRVAAVGLMNIPLPQTPVPGKRKGNFSITYPLKPGLTVFMVAYSSNYSDENLKLADDVNFPIDHAELYVNPPDLTVTSPLFQLAGQDSKSGSAVYTAENVPARAALSASLSGAPAPAGQGSNPSDENATEPQVKVVPGSVTKIGVPLLLCFLLVLLWALGIRVSKEWPRWKAHREGSPVQKQFQAKFDSVVHSIAALDELRAADKIPEKRYWKERLELKAKAVAILKKGPTANSESYAARNSSP
jgi:hypothetical protein